MDSNNTRPERSASLSSISAEELFSALAFEQPLPVFDDEDEKENERQQQQRQSRKKKGFLGIGSMFKPKQPRKQKESVNETTTIVFEPTEQTKEREQEKLKKDVVLVKKEVKRVVEGVVDGVKTFAVPEKAPEEKDSDKMTTTSNGTTPSSQVDNDTDTENDADTENENDGSVRESLTTTLNGFVQELTKEENKARLRRGVHTAATSAWQLTQQGVAVIQKNIPAQQSSSSPTSSFSAASFTTNHHSKKAGMMTRPNVTLTLSDDPYYDDSDSASEWTANAPASSNKKWDWNSLSGSARYLTKNVSAQASVVKTQLSKKSVQLTDEARKVKVEDVLENAKWARDGLFSIASKVVKEANHVSSVVHKVQAPVSVPHKSQPLPNPPIVRLNSADAAAGGP